MVATLTHFIYGFLGWEIIGREIPLWAALLICQLPDFDFGIGLIEKNKYLHRRYFHNIFSALIIIIIFSYFFGFLGPFILIATHIFLDLFDRRGVPLFYPFIKKEYIIRRLGTVRDLPEKLYWDNTWWFYGIAVVVYVVFLFLKYLT